MRIETLLQNPKVREALNRAIADDHWLLRGESSLSEQEARERAEESRVALVTALLAALAGEGETLEAAYKVAWFVEAPEEHKCLYSDRDLCCIGHECTEWHNALLRARLEAAAPVLTAPLLARVATLEAEKTEMDERGWELDSKIRAVEAERDRLREGVTSIRDRADTGQAIPEDAAEGIVRTCDTLLGETGR